MEGRGVVTMASISLQDLRRRLYVKAKADKDWRVWGLYVHVAKQETLGPRTTSPSTRTAHRIAGAALVGRRRSQGAGGEDLCEQLHVGDCGHRLLRCA
jgi:hypothetical protein